LIILLSFGVHCFVEDESPNLSWSFISCGIWASLAYLAPDKWFHFPRLQVNWKKVRAQKRVSRRFLTKYENLRTVRDGATGALAQKQDASQAGREQGLKTGGKIPRHEWAHSSWVQACLLPPSQKLGMGWARSQAQV
jgi:hypothetical protein